VGWPGGHVKKGWPRTCRTCWWGLRLCRVRLRKINESEENITVTRRRRRRRRRGRLLIFPFVHKTERREEYRQSPLQLPGFSLFLSLSLSISLLFYWTRMVQGLWAMFPLSFLSPRVVLHREKRWAILAFFWDILVIYRGPYSIVLAWLSHLIVSSSIHSQFFIVLDHMLSS